MANSMQSLFLRAHAVLHPEGAAMRELLEAGVSEHRVTSLYPYELRDWLPALISEHQLWSSKFEESRGASAYGAPMWRTVGVKNLELHARMRGIEEESRRLPQRSANPALITAMAQCFETLSSPQGEQWLAAMGFTYDSARDMQPLAVTISVLDEFVAIASRWPELADLHQHAAQWRPYIEASLAIMAPNHFELDHPPVRYDTMMFR